MLLFAALPGRAKCRIDRVIAVLTRMAVAVRAHIADSIGVYKR